MPVLLALASVVVSCSAHGIQVRIPIIDGLPRSVKNEIAQQIKLSFDTADPALVPNDFSVATATVISPLITSWSYQDQTVRDGESLSYIHPLLGPIRVAVHAEANGTVRYFGTMSDNQSHFIAVVNADGTFRYDQIIVATLVETADPPVQSYQMYTHSTFTGSVTSDGGYRGKGNAFNLASTIAYPKPPNPDIAMQTGTVGYCLTYAVKSVPSKSFFGIEFYPWDDGYTDSAAIILSVANSSFYDRTVTAKSLDPHTDYSYMFYWRSGVFYQIPWGPISRLDIPDTWDKF
jgi:hypothetical protein